MPTPISRRPAVMFKNTGNDRITGLVSAADRSRVKAGSVQFGFRNKAELNAFKAEIRTVYPLFSSAQFKELVERVCGPDALVKVQGREVVNVSREDLALLKNGPALAKKLAAMKNPPFSPESAAFIAGRVRFVLDTTDVKGRSVFDLLDINSRKPTDTPSRNGRINAIDVERLVINTSLFSGLFDR